VSNDQVTETTERATETTTQQPAGAAHAEIRGDSQTNETAIPADSSLRSSVDSSVRSTDQAGADQTVAGFTDLASANREISRLRRENAERRTSGRDLQAQIDELKKQVPSADIQQQINDLQTQLQRYQAAGEAGISPELLAASEELRQATTADEMRQASERIARLTAQQNGGNRNPAPPREPSAPPSRDEQITAALRDRNMREYQRLNAEKLADLGI